MWGLASVTQYLVLMTTFLYWTLRATQRLHQLCRYIASTRERSSR